MAGGGELSGRASSSQSPSWSQAEDHLPTYKRAVQSYEALIQEFRPKLDISKQEKIDLSLQFIRNNLPDAIKGELQQFAGSRTERTQQSSPEVMALPTYVGKASDIHFIHSIRQCIGGCNLPEKEDEAADYYSQSHALRSLVALNHPLLIPNRADAQKYVDVYLSTIHIAYPFLHKAVLLEQFQRFQAGNHGDPEYQTWLALFSKGHLRISVSNYKVIGFKTLTIPYILYLLSDRIMHLFRTERTRDSVTISDISNRGFTFRES